MKAEVIQYAAGRPGIKRVSKETLNHRGLIELVSGLDVHTHTRESYLRAYEALGIDLVNRVPMENAPPPTPRGERRMHPDHSAYDLCALGVYDTVHRRAWPCAEPDDIWLFDVAGLRYEHLVTPVPHPVSAVDACKRQAALGEIGLYYPMLYTMLFMWPVEVFGWEPFMLAAGSEPEHLPDGHPLASWRLREQVHRGRSARRPFCGLRNDGRRPCFFLAEGSRLRFHPPPGGGGCKSGPGPHRRPVDRHPRRQLPHVRLPELSLRHGGRPRPDPHAREPNDRHVSGTERSLLLGAQGHMEVWFFGNDFGSQEALLFSRDMWAEFFLDNLKRLTALAHTHGLKVMMHSCGAIAELIPLLIEAGVDILDPIQVTAKGMEPTALKTRFGDRLIFHGGIDTQQVLPFADSDDVARHVRQTVTALGSGGGYIFAPSQILGPDISTENIVTMYDQVC